jgi:hypothetical protein
MPCILAILALAFPRVVIVVLYLFTNFFTGLYQGILVPLLGFIFLPITFLAYSYFLHGHYTLGPTQVVILIVAALIDLGMIGGGARPRRRV